MSTDTTSTSSVSAEQERGSRYLIAAGIVIALLGVVSIFAPLVTGSGISIVLGALLVVGGFTHVTHAFSVQGWTGWLWQLVLAGVYVIAGISLLANPVLGLTTLTVLLIGYLFVTGAVELAMGVQMRPTQQWGLVAGSGVVSLLLAVLLWLGFPSTAAWAIGLIVGVHLLTAGLALVALGYMGQPSPAGRGETTGGTPRGG